MLLRYKLKCKNSQLPIQVAVLQEGVIQAENQEHAKTILSMMLAILVDKHAFTEEALQLDNWDLEETGSAVAGWVRYTI